MAPSGDLLPPPGVSFASRGTRRDGWEERLLAVIADARARPYVLGEHDCFRVACQVVEALTGVERWADLAGYKTKKQAKAKISKYGKSFEAAGDWFFGSAAIDVKLARRGDICCIETADGEKHLGVCLGRDTALLSETGLVYVPTLACRCAWRVG